MPLSVEQEQTHKRNLYEAIARVKSYSWLGRFIDKQGFIIDLNMLKHSNNAVSQLIEHCNPSDPQLKVVSLEADRLLIKYGKWLKK